jgi:hypothetical protein
MALVQVRSQLLLSAGEVVGQFQEVPIPLIEHPLLDRFVPRELRGTGSFDEVRARLLALSTISIWIWGPAFALVHLVSGNWGQALMCLFFSLLVIPVPLILKWTGSFALVGSLLSAVVWLLLTIFAFHRGGLHSAAMFWYVLAPIPAHIFGSRSGFRVSLTVSIATPFIFWGLKLYGFSFPTTSGTSADLIWTVSAAGLLVLIPQLFVMNSGLQKWLANVARSKEAEKRAVEVELQDTQLARTRGESEERSQFDGELVRRDRRLSSRPCPRDKRRVSAHARIHRRQRPRGHDARRTGRCGGPCRSA